MLLFSESFIVIFVTILIFILSFYQSIFSFFFFFQIRLISFYIEFLILSNPRIRRIFDSRFLLSIYVFIIIIILYYIYYTFILYLFNDSNELFNHNRMFYYIAIKFIQRAERYTFVSFRVRKSTTFSR